MSDPIILAFISLGGGVITYLLKEVHNLKKQNRRLEHIIIGLAVDLRDPDKTREKIAEDILKRLRALNGKVDGEDLSNALD